MATVKATRFTFANGTTQYTIAVADLADAVKHEIWMHNGDFLSKFENLTHVQPIFRSLYNMYATLEESESAYTSEYDTFNNFQEAMEKLNDFTDKVIEEMPVEVLEQAFIALSDTAWDNTETVDVEYNDCDQPKFWN